MFISSPGANNGEGKVHMYIWSIGIDGSTFDTWTQVSEVYPTEVHEGYRFGHKVCVNDEGDVLAVSSKSPGNAGQVHIFKRTSNTNNDSVWYTWSEQQVLTGTSSDGSSMNIAFGDSIAMSKSGTELIIGAPGTEVQDGSSTTYKDDAGAVYYYKWNADGSTNTYTLQQTLNAPGTNTNVKFGSTVNINQAGNRIAIGAIGADNPRTMRFDSGATTFDLQDTNIVDINREAGVVYVGTKYDTKFIIDERLINDKRISLISATGSTRMGKRIGEVVGARLGKTILELGGNNAIIVDETADMEMVIPAILFGAVGTAGQRCTSTRRIIVKNNIYDIIACPWTCLPQKCFIFKIVPISPPISPTFHRIKIIICLDSIGHVSCKCL